MSSDEDSRPRRRPSMTYDVRGGTPPWFLSAASAVHPHGSTPDRQNGEAMTDRSLDELGPVDYLIVEFPAGQQNFTGEGADELLRLHDAGTIRIMDVLILSKNDDGSVEAMELSDLPELGELT